jgi:hypothetical protein
MAEHEPSGPLSLLPTPEEIVLRVLKHRTSLLQLDELVQTLLVVV